jgi:hypothetical protein
LHINKKRRLQRVRKASGKTSVRKAEGAEKSECQNWRDKESTEHIAKEGEDRHEKGGFFKFNKRGA